MSVSLGNNALKDKDFLLWLEHFFLPVQDNIFCFINVSVVQCSGKRTREEHLTVLSTCSPTSEHIKEVQGGKNNFCGISCKDSLVIW